jgi:shikimate dehydrogenase
MITGTTRLYVIVGHPIGKVRSPETFNAGFGRHGIDAVMVPIEASPDDLMRAVVGLKSIRNVDGIVFTFPHKVEAMTLVDYVNESGRLVGAINAARRDAAGRWVGDMFDGAGFVGGMRRHRYETAGRRAALIGAGGAGRAIAFALAAAGVASISVHDLDEVRATRLASDLAKAHPSLATRAGPPKNGDIELLVNATPIGMRADDPLPWPVDGLREGTVVGDVTTKPEVTPFLAAARERGGAIVTGRDMHESQLAALFNFFGFEVDPLR